MKLPGGFAYHPFVDAAGGEGKESFALSIGATGESADQVLARIVRALRDRDPKLTQPQALLKASRPG